eukprot:5418057-Alexandrium_andersonii.AAC.1
MTHREDGHAANCAFHVFAQRNNARHVACSAWLCRGRTTDITSRPLSESRGLGNESAHLNP